MHGICAQRLQIASDGTIWWISSSSKTRAKMNPETVEGILSVVVIGPQRARCS